MFTDVIFSPSPPEYLKAIFKSLCFFIVVHSKNMFLNIMNKKKNQRKKLSKNYETHHQFNWDYCMGIYALKKLVKYASGEKKNPTNY